MKSNSSQLSVLGHLIGGHHITGGERSLEICNPSTGEVAKRVDMASAEIAGKAVGAATQAFPEWRNTPPMRRARVMQKLKGLLERHSEKICHLITQEHGKVLTDAMGELQRGIENVEYTSFAPELLKGEHSCKVGSGIDSWSEFQPLGVCVGVTPFNFPAMVPLWMWPMAVVCGNTFVLKPSERDPSAAFLITELGFEAGLPPGVLNVINGDKSAVDALLHHPNVAAVSFVGSTPIAQCI